MPYSTAQVTHGPSYLAVACGRGNRPCWKPLSEGVNLTPRTVDALKAHRKKQLEEKIRLAGLYKDHGLIFASRIDTPVNPENLVKRSFKPPLQRAGLPRIRFHDLRHTCATLLLTRNVHPKHVQELLSHATVGITLDTYSHVIPGIGNHAARAMEDVFPYSAVQTSWPLMHDEPSALNNQLFGCQPLKTEGSLLGKVHPLRERL